eukprot:1187693-Prorocentrum_minimum.AAC.3
MHPPPNEDLGGEANSPVAEWPNKGLMAAWSPTDVPSRAAESESKLSGRETLLLRNPAATIIIIIRLVRVRNILHICRRDWSGGSAGSAGSAGSLGLTGLSGLPGQRGTPDVLPHSPPDPRRVEAVVSSRKHPHARAAERLLLPPQVLSAERAARQRAGPPTPPARDGVRNRAGGDAPGGGAGYRQGD